MPQRTLIHSNAGVRLEQIEGEAGTLYKVRSYRPFGKHFADKGEAEMEYAREISRCLTDPVCKSLAARGW